MCFAKKQELMGIIKNSLEEMDGTITKPDQEGYVSRISVGAEIESDGVLVLSYNESEQVDKYKITVELIK